MHFQFQTYFWETDFFLPREMPKKKPHCKLIGKKKIPSQSKIKLYFLLGMPRTHTLKCNVYAEMTEAKYFNSQRDEISIV